MRICTGFHSRGSSNFALTGVLLSVLCYQKVLLSQDDLFGPESSTATLHVLVVDPEGRPIPNAMFQEGLDLEQIENNFINIQVSTGMPKRMAWFSGRFENDGHFEITIPNDVQDDDVLTLRVPGTELQINQRTPWKLSPVSSK